jgi:predicted nucleic-acid-binding protein
MAALDTNILLRLLIRDHAAQSTLAQKLLHKCVNDRERLYVPVSVMLELEWVLRSRYEFDKPAVADIFLRLLATCELSFESEGALEVALFLFGQSNADFSDCLHVALAYTAQESPLWTLDKAASKLEGARLLTA